MNYDKLTNKKKIIDQNRPLDANLLKNLEEWFKIELTYTSNAIEGNTLTRAETALVVEKGLTVSGKSIIEHLEAQNHALALDFIKDQIKRKISTLKEKDILQIHEIILGNISKENAGIYRNVPVRISGSAVVLPNPLKLQKLMDEFLSWLRTQKNMHPIQLAAEAHYRLVTIHPFIDGNGRTARLLMNMILIMQGYPPAIIKKTERLSYIKSLEKAQLANSQEEAKTNYHKLIATAVERSLNIYLNAINGKQAKFEDEKLLKIGQLASKTNTTLATIRHWVSTELIEVADITDANYQMFAPDIVKKIEKIKSLKSKGLSLSQIKDKIQH